MNSNYICPRGQLTDGTKEMAEARRMFPDLPMTTARQGALCAMRTWDVDRAFSGHRAGWAMLMCPDGNHDASDLTHWRWEAIDLATGLGVKTGKRPVGILSE